MPEGDTNEIQGHDQVVEEGAQESAEEPNPIDTDYQQQQLSNEAAPPDEQQQEMEQEQEGGQMLTNEDQPIVAVAEIQETPVIGRGNEKLKEEDRVLVKSMASLGGQDSRLSQTKKVDEIIVVSKEGDPVSAEQ